MPSYKNHPVVSVDNSTVPSPDVGPSPAAAVVGINDAPTPPVQPAGKFDLGIGGEAGRGGWFQSDHGEGVRGWSKNPDHGGVVGVNTAGGIGTYGTSDDGIGVQGESESNEGVRGVSHGLHAGVVGVNTAGGAGGWFQSDHGEGVRGWSKTPGQGGVVGVNTAGGDGGDGGFFQSDHGEGVRGWSKNPNHGGVVGVNTGGGTAIWAETTVKDSDSAALYAKHAGNRTAAFFEGSIVVTGDISLTNGDCAEDFDIADACSAEPGTLMVLDEDSTLQACLHPYDKRVAGVVSGACNLKPGLVLDKQANQVGRKPIALLGKVYCKVDAQFGPISVGDLLTTSPTAGHAMRVGDPLRAFGAVIGKAMRPLATGCGLIPILITLG